MSGVYALFRQENGELTVCVEVALPLPKMVEALNVFVEGHGVTALDDYVVVYQNGGSVNARAWWIRQADEPTDDNGYSIYRLDPAGARETRLAQDLTALEAMAFLTGGSGTPGNLGRYEVVQQFDGKVMTAAQFVDRRTTVVRAADKVVAAYKAGTSRAAGVRGQSLASWWPALGEALDELSEALGS